LQSALPNGISLAPGRYKNEPFSNLMSTTSVVIHEARRLSLIERIDGAGGQIEAHPWVAISVCGFLYFFGFGALAYSSTLSSDEIFSLYVSWLPNVATILRALSQGADTHPPLHYLLLHGAHRLFGNSTLAGRFPFLLAEWGMVLLLYRFVARRCSPIYGMIAALIPLLTDYANFSHVGRPYALNLCAYAMALWFWQAAARPRNVAALAGLAVTGIFAVSAHFYGGFALLPIAVGELWRYRTTRRLNLGVWLAMILGTSPIVLFRPQIRAIARGVGAAGLHSSATITSPTLQKLFATYADSMQPALIIVLLGLTAAVLFGSGRDPAAAANPPSQGLSQPEMAASFTLMFIPILLYVIGRTVTGGYGTAYGCSVCIGAGLLVAQLAFRLFSRQRSQATILAALLLVGFALGQLQNARSWRAHPWTRFQPSTLLTGKSGVGSLPVVISQIVPFLQLVQYSDPPLKGRLAYLIDPKHAASFGDLAPDVALQQLRPWATIPVQDYSAFVKANPSFLVYNWGHIQGWLVPYLLRQGASVEVLATDGPHQLLAITVHM
jgi:hypothetical protein